MAKKLLHIITAKKNSGPMTKALIDAGFYITVMEASGGFTKKKFSIIMLGLGEEKIPKVVELAKGCCSMHKENTVNSVPIPTVSQEDIVQQHTTSAVEVKIGGATILVSPLDEIHKV